MCSSVGDVGGRKKDQRFPVPGTTRHVWLRAGPGRPEPVQAFVIEWKRFSYRWFAWCSSLQVDDQGRPLLRCEWYEVEQLIPVRSDPNNGGRVRHLGL